MKTVGLFEAKQKLSELVDKAERGEKIGITRRGKLSAILVPVSPQRTAAEIVEDIFETRKGINKDVPFSIKEAIEEGRL